MTHDGQRTRRSGVHCRRRFIRSWGVCIAVFANSVGGYAVTPATAEFTTPTALTGVTIVTDTGRTIESATIVMADGLFVAVGADVEIPPNAELIDGTGLRAYPGFIDAQTHIGIAEEARSVEERQRTEDENPDHREGPLTATRFANRRGIRPLWRAVQHYVADETARQSHRKAGFTAVAVSPRDGIFAGTSDLLDLSDLPLRRSVLADRLGMHASFTTGEDGEYPSTLLGVFAQFRQVLLDAGHHAKLKKYVQRHPQTGPRIPHDEVLDSLMPLLAGRQPIIFEANSEREIRRAISLSDEFGLRVVIAGAKEAWRVSGLLKERRIPLIVSLKFDDEPEYGKKKKGGQKSREKKRDEGEADESSEEEKKGESDEIYEPLKLRKERRRLWEEQVHNVVRLHEAGIGFSLRTRDFKKPDNFLKNLRMVMERGLPESAVVKALTSQPAMLFGLDNRLGSISPDRIANLTLMDKPIADEKAKVKYVFIGGKKFETHHEEDKKKKRDEKKGGEPDEKKKTSADKNDSPPSDEENEGPVWAVEIKADRKPTTSTGGSVLIQNATIIPITSPRIDNGSILIERGKITAIGENLTAPEGMAVIDATGRFVIPGFVDAHSHLGLDAVNESPLAISAEVRIADVINPTSVAIYRAVAGGATTHHAMHGSANPIGGQNTTLKLKYGRPASEMLIGGAGRTIKFATGENVKQSNFFKAWGKRFPNSRMGVEAVYRQGLEAARSYVAKRQEYQQKLDEGLDVSPFRRDLRLEALTEILSGDLSVHAHCYRSEEIVRLMGVAEEYGFRIGTLQHVLEGYRIAPEIARHGAGASTFSNFWGYKIEAYGAIPHNAAFLTASGVTTSVNSDSANTIRYLGQEAAKSIRWGGLSEIEALRLVTLNPAMQLQVDDRVGSLEVDKDGDIAIFNGHPLNTFSKCVMTLIEGEVYFEDPRPEPVERCDSMILSRLVDHTIPKPTHHAYAIVGATIHTISGPVIENGTVVVINDEIHAVGAKVPVPPGAGVINGSGLHVYPGLIDGGSTVGLTEIGSLRATRDNREIGTLNPQLKAASAVHPHSEHIRIARTGGTTTLVTKPSGGIIAGQSAAIHLDGWTLRDMLVKDMVGLHMSVPSLPVRLPSAADAKKKRKEEHRKQLRKLEEFVSKSKRYAKTKSLWNVDPTIEFDVDLSLEAMIPYVQREKPIIFSASAYKHILDTIEFAAKHDLRCIIAGGREAWKLADVLANRGVAVILGTPLSYPRGEFEPWDSVYRCALELDRAGVDFCFATESTANAYDLGVQAGMAVAHGLPAERAEHGLTLGAAKIFGIDDRVGSIEVGKQADLIVTTASPLQAASVVTHMFIAGNPVELTSMHTENYEKFKNRPTPTLPPLPELKGPPNLTGR